MLDMGIKHFLVYQRIKTLLKCSYKTAKSLYCQVRPTYKFYFNKHAQVIKHLLYST